MNQTKTRIWSLLLIAILATGGLSARPHKKTEIRIACVGASITEGAMTTHPITDSYPAQLGKMLGKGYQVMNFGKGGCTMLRKGDFPYWERDEYKAALASNPDIVFIDLG